MQTTETAGHPEPWNHRAAGATYGPSRRHRYLLWRVWAPQGPLAGFVLLNPSTATARILDPTLKRCCGFSRSWGCRGMLVANVFALRSTDPAALRRARDPVGPGNDSAIRRVVRAANLLVVGWGNHGMLADRSKAVQTLLQDELSHRSATDGALCFGLTASGQPLHPLYLAADRPLVAFSTQS